MSMDHHPPRPGPGDRRILLFWNKGKDTIRINHVMFQSDIYPRTWDTTGDDPLLRENEYYKMQIVGTGQVFLRWHAAGEERADSFKVHFATNGVPYPYIFGGDQWTMALRHAALKSYDDDGEERPAQFHPGGVQKNGDN